MSLLNLIVCCLLLHLANSSLLYNAPLHGATSKLCPDRNTECSPDNTCCPLADGKYGCCKYSNGVCCEDKEHCCPNNAKCGQNGARFGCVDKDGRVISENYENEYLDSYFYGWETCPSGYCLNEFSTCCGSSSSGFYCCPIHDGVCCGDGSWCCGKGSRCGPTPAKGRDDEGYNPTCISPDGSITVAYLGNQPYVKKDTI